MKRDWNERIRRGDKIVALFVALFFLLFYIYFQSSSIYGGDAGDLVSAAFVRGVAHPPGYPLYTFLGWLLTKIPFSTVAWRVGLLSSIPAALSLGLFYLVLRKLSPNKTVSIITVLTLGFSYLYWLYAIVPEVFALHILFVVSLLYLVLLYREIKSPILLYLTSFFFGLSLTHHHTIVFIAPVYIYLIWSVLKMLKAKKKLIRNSLLLFFIGLLPYLYVVLAAHGNPVVNWEDPKTINGLIRLVTRAIYGTFRSGQDVQSSFGERIRLLKIGAETFYIDFTSLGVFISALGAFFLYRNSKTIFRQIMLLFLFSGPFFIVYTGFPSVLNFQLGTVERFLLIPYVFLCIFIAFGIKYTSLWIDILIRKIIHKPFFISSAVAFLIFPVILILTNYPKLAPLKNDRTAENLGKDILQTSQDRALLFLSEDTPAFNTQYVYLTQGNHTWRNIKLIQLGLLIYPFYQNLLSNQFPDIDLTGIANSKDTLSVLNILVDRYYNIYPIFFGRPFDFSKNYVFIQSGLLNRLYKISDLRTLSVDNYRRENEQLFSSYQDPLAGALNSYTHVLLADSARVYADARYKVGTNFLNFKDYILAEKYFREALRLQPEVTKNGLKLAETLILQLKCDEAGRLLTDYENRFSFEVEVYRMQAVLFRDCYKDENKTKEYDRKYQMRQKDVQTDLNEF